MVQTKYKKNMNLNSNKNRLIWSLAVLFGLVGIALLTIGNDEATLESSTMLLRAGEDDVASYGENDRVSEEKEGSLSQGKEEIKEKSQPSASSRSDLPENLTAWEACNVNSLCQTRTPKNNQDDVPLPKPLWLSGFPMSGDELLRPTKLIEILLGQSMAGKSFYASGKNAKKCMDKRPGMITATCSQIHPIVGLSPSPPDRAIQFDSQVLMTIRNPAMAIPAYVQNKANLYHHVVGQMNESEWKEFRDKSLDLHSWIDMVETWKSYTPTYYNISYIQYEKILNFETGPIIVEKLIESFAKAGFTNLPIIQQVDSNDKNTISCVQCIWYKSITKERLIQYETIGYEYSDYIPGYTIAQRDKLIQQLNEIIQKHSDDKEFVKIIQEYVFEIQNNIRIDE